MQVVLLSYYFPPDQAVGALRPAKVCAALRAAGHRVTVIAGRIPGVSDTEPDVVRVRTLPNPREAWLALKALLAGEDNGRIVHSADPSTAGSAMGSTDGQTLKRWMSSVIWLPDDRQGFVIPAVTAALSAVANGADLIYTTAPPFSTHLAGLLLKRLTGVRWVAEFRDPWTDNPWKPPHVRSQFSDAVERMLERSCLRSADLIVSVSAGIAKALEHKIPGGAPKRRKTLLVRNGIDRIAAPSIARQRTSGTFRVVHIGTCYQHRDPRPFLAGLALKHGALVRRGIHVQVHLVGECRWYNDISLEETVRALGLSDAVTFSDWVPHERALALVDDADLLLLFAQGQPAQVPNKLYEYLGTRRPILAFVDEEGESASLLRMVGDHFVVTDGTAESAADAIERAATAVPRGGNETALTELTSANQMARLVAFLEREGSFGVG